MPMTKCPTCGNGVSTDAVLCPKCGHQFKAAGAFNLKDPVHLGGCIVIVVLLAFMLIMAVTN
jgi:hypothetical protein